MAENDPDVSPRSERYKVLVDELKTNHTLFNDATRNTATLLLVALGWFIAIKGTDSPLKSNASIARITEGFLVLLAAAHIGSLAAIRKRTESLKKRIGDLNYAPASDTEHFNITWPHFLSAAVSNGLLFVLIVLLVRAIAPL